MAQVISEGLQYIGRIDEKGYVFDSSGECVAKIDESGYIMKLAGYGYYGKIDRDGTVRDASLTVVGNIQADGYVYIHSKRICRVDSQYIRNITPDAWNYGHPDDYPNRVEQSYDTAGSGVEWHWPFGFGTTVKLIVGVALGIGAIVTNAGALGFGGCLLAIPVCVATVFIVCLVIKVISGG